MDNEKKESCGCQNNQLNCTKITTQCADVSLPIKIKPYAVVGNIETECFGKPIVSLRSFQGMSCCNGGECEITITQSICIKIPVEYGAITDVGSTTVHCKKCNDFYAKE